MKGQTKARKYTNGKIWDESHKDLALKLWLKGHKKPYLFGPKCWDRMHPKMPAQSTLIYGNFTFEIYEIQTSELDLSTLKIENFTNQKCVRYFIND